MSKAEESYMTDHTGKPSATRAMCVVALVTAIVIALGVLTQPLWAPGADISGSGRFFFTILLAAAFGGKSVGAVIELYLTRG